MLLNGSVMPFVMPAVLGSASAATPLQFSASISSVSAIGSTAASGVAFVATIQSRSQVGGPLTPNATYLKAKIYNNHSSVTAQMSVQTQDGTVAILSVSSTAALVTFAGSVLTVEMSPVVTSFDYITLGR